MNRIGQTPDYVLAEGVRMLRRLLRLAPGRDYRELVLLTGKALFTEERRPLDGGTGPTVRIEKPRRYNR